MSACKVDLDKIASDENEFALRSNSDVKIPGAEAVGIMNNAVAELKAMFEKHAVCPSHGIEHPVRVMNQAALAV